MSLFTIGDLHLSFSCNKPMDIFKGWEDYVSRLSQNWNALVKAEDTVVVAGDISWGMSMEEAKADFDFIEALPGKKILLRGNHDYWFSTKKKCDSFFLECGYSTISMLFNNAFSYGDYPICGTRGWVNEQGTPNPADKKIIDREVGRLRLSLEAAKPFKTTPLVFLHYPPVYYTNQCEPILQVLHEYGIKRCFYGHIHGGASQYAIDGVLDGIDYRLISCDYVNFSPVLVM